MGTGERCDACYYSYDLCETVMNCEAGKWRRRALAAEADLGATEAERDSLRTALADRDQQLAAAKEEIAHLKQDLKDARAVIENLWSTTNA